jgi:hypothetical protein
MGMLRANVGQQILRNGDTITCGRFTFRKASKPMLLEYRAEAQAAALTCRIDQRRLAAALSSWNSRNSPSALEILPPA